MGRVKSRSVLVSCFVAVAACQTRPLNTVPRVARIAPALTVPSKAPDAAAYEPFGETVGLRVGGLVTSAIDTSASLGVRGTARGTEFDFERELGMEKTTESFRADLHWRIDRNDRIDVGYFDLTRSGSRTIGRDIEWGDVTFPIGTTVSSFVDTRIMPVRYSHSFVASRSVDAGLGLGVYYMELDTGLSGTALGVSESFDTPVPLPVVSAHVAWEFLPRLQLVGLLQAFYVDLEGTGTIEQLRGRVIDATVGVEFAVHDNFGIGAGGNYFEIAVDTTTTRLDFEFDYGYTAAMLYLFLEI
jgi:hypothetical protein